MEATIAEFEERAVEAAELAAELALCTEEDVSQWSAVLDVLLVEVSS